jgi:transcription elongation factor Elf1
VPIKKARKAAQSLKKTAKKKVKKIVCSHPKDLRIWIHVEETNTTIEVCANCGAKFTRVAFKKRTNPIIEYEEFVEMMKKKNPRFGG